LWAAQGRGNCVAPDCVTAQIGQEYGHVVGADLQPDCAARLRIEREQIAGPADAGAILSHFLDQVERGQFVADGRDSGFGQTIALREGRPRLRRIMPEVKQQR